MTKTINGAMFRKMMLAGAAYLEQNKDTVDSLNVFPVADKDTGTNMNLTLKTAVNELNSCTTNKMEDLCSALAKGALRGARGNSGVILSQILKGMTTILKEKDEITTKHFARSLNEAAKVAYQAVTKPKEGTILTVIRVIAEEATSAAKKMPEFEDFLKYIIERGEEAVQKTPELLPVLAKAGVVDSGGRGLMYIFGGFYKVIINDEDFEFEMVDTAKQMDNIKNFHVNLEALEDITYGYCTQFTIIHMFPKTTESDIDKLREKLMNLGDSVICVGDLSFVRVHVHTNEPNKAIGYAIEMGELFDVKVDNMREQNREFRKQNAKLVEEQNRYGLVAVVPGDGVAAVFKDIGVDELISGGQTMNPCADDIAKAVDKVPSNNVFVFPNNKNIILAAEQAKTLTEKNITIIPTVNVPQGIAAILAFNPDGSLEENIDAMVESMENVRAASITQAAKSVHMDGFDIKEGEIIGLDEKAILVKDTLVAEAVMQLVEKLMTDTTANITLFWGADIREDDANAMQERLAQKYPDCEITVIYGGQPVYHYIVSME